jgi:amino acid transporter
MSNLKKNFYDRSVPTRNLWTTVTGVIVAVISILTAVNLLSADDASQLQIYSNDIIGAVKVIVEAVTGIILMFKATDS